MSTKYIFVTGGVVSGLGKGITAASLGRLLKARGYKVTIQKFDPYMNIHTGMMSPFQHGEIFVTEDGSETDLDIGHYERFIDENLSSANFTTAGKVYWSVMDKEKNGDFDGSTIQVVPHITNEIKERMCRLGKSDKYDVIISEIGGTVGDIEISPFLEATRQIAGEVGRRNCLFVHVALVPFIPASGEFKTKPTQHSCKQLRNIGIQPDIIVCRTEKQCLDTAIRNKIALFCNIPSECVIENVDMDMVYEVPMFLEDQKLGDITCSKLGLESPEPDLTGWRDIADRFHNVKHNAKVAIVGRYVQVYESYLSIIEALSHSGLKNYCNVEVSLVDSAKLTSENLNEQFAGVQGILLPDDVSKTGASGMIIAAKYARENNIPFLSMGMGMQMAVVEFARNVCGMEGASSTEISPDTAFPVVWLPLDEDNSSAVKKRLGTIPCRIADGSALESIYNEKLIYERHRCRYEINQYYKDTLAEKGLVAAAYSADNKFIEAMVLNNHRWFLGIQFHPEFKSRPNKSHPIFDAFIKEAISV